MLDPDEIARLMDRKRAERTAAIAALHRAGVADGGPDDPGFWTLVHDLERAPTTTNLAQLAEIGVDPPDPRVLADAELESALAELVAGLAALEVYLLRTDHLGDRALYTLLRSRILQEVVREVPPGCGSREWIDLGGGGDRETWLAWYADDDARMSAAELGEFVPARREPRADRDRTLPRPSPIGPDRETPDRPAGSEDEHA